MNLKMQIELYILGYVKDDEALDLCSYYKWFVCEMMEAQLALKRQGEK